MRYFLDKALGGHVLLFDGPKELVESARDANTGKNPFHKVSNFAWPGRVVYGNDWNKCAGFLSSPWPEAANRVRWVVEQVKQSRDIPIPKSIRRKASWNPDDGEVDVDRAMSGEPEMYRIARRHRTNNPMHVALISNLEETNNYIYINPSGVYFRSVATIALADILEDAGYSVEVWIWSRGLNVYPEPNSEQFTACKVKAAGDMVDYDALCDAMSGWFQLHAMVGVMAANPEAKPLRKGEGVEPSYELKTKEDGSIDWWEYGTDEWIKYLDIEENCQIFPVPMMVGGGMQTAAEGCKEVLERIIGET